MADYDVYHQWLGIPPEDQPPSLYRLLGVTDFEQDSEVIRNAAERQTMHVRRLARGEFTDAGQELLNEIAEAKLVLLSAEQREAYDRVLRQNQQPGPDAGLESEAALEPPHPDVYLTTPEATLIETGDPMPGHSEQGRWIIGYHADCDCRVEGNTISGIHCQITAAKGKLFVADLGSTNGTYVNQQRIKNTQEVYPIDLLTLGPNHRILVPSQLFASEMSHRATAIFLGTGKGNEVQLDSAGVSRYHARLVFNQRAAVVEDLNSKRGTHLQRDGSEPTRITRSRLRKDDVLCFADVRIEARTLLSIAARRLER